MSFIENIIYSLGPYLTAYAKSITFVGAAIWGEVVVISLAFLAAQGLYPLWIVFVFGLLGTIFADCLWFLLGRIKLFNKNKILRKIVKKYKKIEKKIERFGKNNDFAIIFVTKFLYGTRIITAIYVGLNKRLKFGRFLLYDSISTIIWLTSMIAIGWLAGKGVEWIVHLYKSLGLALTILIGLVILFVLLEKKLNKKIAN